MAALKILAESGLSPDELLASVGQQQTDRGIVATNGRQIPTVSAYLPVVRDAIRNRATLETWILHFATLEELYAVWLVTAVGVDELRAVQKIAGDRARARRPNSTHNGMGAEENAVNAMRFFFNRVVDAGYRPDNPGLRLKVPKRRRHPRRHLEPDELSQIWTVTCSGGDDPLLDALLVRSAVELGARLGGLVNLQLLGVDRKSLRILLVEKFGKRRWVPVTTELADALIDFAASRGSTRPEDPVFRYRPKGANPVGDPLTRRRFNTLFERIQRALPWAAQEGVSLHWCRHTAGAAMERIGGVAVAAEFLGHEHPGNVTLHYSKALAREVATAFSILTGELHPLAYADALSSGVVRPAQPRLRLPGEE